MSINLRRFIDDLRSTFTDLAGDIPGIDDMTVPLELAFEKAVSESLTRHLDGQVQPTLNLPAPARVREAKVSLHGPGPSKGSLAAKERGAKAAATRAENKRLRELENSRPRVAKEALDEAESRSNGSTVEATGD